MSTISERDRPILESLEICYAPSNYPEASRVKRINLFDYFDLAETLVMAKAQLNRDTLKGGAIYFSLMALPGKLKAFIDEGNGFSTCKHSASELKRTVDEWLSANIWDGQSEFAKAKFDDEFSEWQYRHIATKIETFRNVFEAECHDVDVYSVGQIAIYKTRDLVANASRAISDEFSADMSAEARKEFDDVACCRFHGHRVMVFLVKPESLHAKTNIQPRV
jgi:hypothetical protein